MILKGKTATIKILTVSCLFLFTSTFAFVQPTQTPQTITQAMFEEKASVFNSTGASSPTGILLQVFSDRSFSQLKTGVDLAKIDNLIEQAKTLDDYGKTVEILQEAKKLLADKNAFAQLTQTLSQVRQEAQTRSEETVITLSQNGIMNDERDRAGMSFGLLTLDPTGFYVRPNESISLYVEADENSTNKLRVRFLQIGQIRGNRGLWAGGHWRNQTLEPGINVIDAPAWGGDGTAASDFGPAFILLENNNCPQDQAFAPKVRLVGGMRHPIYRHKETDPAAFRQEINSYLQNVVAQDSEAAEFNREANNLSTKNFNVAALVSDVAFIPTSAWGVQSALNNNRGKATMYETMERWQFVRDQFDIFAGYDIENPASANYRPRGRYTMIPLDLQGGANGYAVGGGYTAYRGTNSTMAPSNKGGSEMFRIIASYNMFEDFIGYLFAHEIGHQYELTHLRWQERTNRPFVYFWQEFFNHASSRIADEMIINANGNVGSMTGFHWNRTNQSYALFVRDPSNRNVDEWNGTIMHQIMWTYGMDAYAKASRYFRDNREDIEAKIGHSASIGVEQTTAAGLRFFETYACVMSLALGLDVTEHFRHYNWNVSDGARQRTGVDKLPKSKRKSWYAYGLKILEEGASGFSQAGVSPVIDGINIDVTNATHNEVLCYEIRRGGNLVGVVYPANGQTRATGIWLTNPTETRPAHQVFDTIRAGDAVTVFDRLCRPHTDYTPGPATDVAPEKTHSWDEPKDPNAPKFMITFSATGEGNIVSAVGGSVSISNNEQVAVGETIVFTASPNEGYRVRHWLVNNKTVQTGGNQFNYTVAAPSAGPVIMISVTFEKVEDVSVRESQKMKTGLFKESVVREKMEIMPEFAVTEVIIYDALGNVVHNSAFRIPNSAFVWDLRNAAGRFVANGSYLVVVEAMDKDGKVKRYSGRVGVKR